MTAFVFCCCGCLVTADVVGTERRQGTLGLLLLTRVNALDLLWGKLGASGLTGFCVLAAFSPLLVFPILGLELKIASPLAALLGGQDYPYRANPRIVGRLH